MDIAEKVSLTHLISLVRAITFAEEIELAIRFSRHLATHAQNANTQKNPNVGSGSCGASKSKGRRYRGRGWGMV